MVKKQFSKDEVNRVLKRFHTSDLSEDIFEDINLNCEEENDLDFSVFNETSFSEEMELW